MLKALDQPYVAGSRGTGWLKVKPVHTLDLVVLAAEWGHGRRRGWLSNLHLGARDPSGDGFVMLGKTFKGLTDEMLEMADREAARAGGRPRRPHRARAARAGRRDRVRRSADQLSLSRRRRAALRAGAAPPSRQARGGGGHPGGRPSKVPVVTTRQEKGEAFRDLHLGEPFIIPNPWDAGSAKVFAGLGFKALATTSAGFAFTLGRLDGQETLDELVDHVRRPRRGHEPAGVGRSRERLRACARRMPRERSHGLRKRARSEARSRTTTPTTGSMRSTTRPSESPLRVRRPIVSTFPSPSRAAPRTTSGCRIRISTTPSLACRPTSEPAPTCCMHPPCAPSRRSEPCPRRRPNH